MQTAHFKPTALALSLGFMTTVPYVLAESNDDIERIDILYRQAYRGDIPARSLPQAISVIEKSVFQDNALTRFQDALDFSASISRQNNGGGLWDSFSLRGFPGNENMPSGYLINGFNGGRGFSGHRDLSNVEYVEILKGPGSALYGRSEPGGTINVVTRKPQKQQEGYLQRFELSGHLNTAGIVHHLLMGADAYDYDLYTLLSRFRGPKGTYALDIFNPVYGGTATAPAPLYENLESQKAWGVYLQDQMDLTQQWKLLLGLRFDDYQQDIQELLKATRSDKSGTQVSPRIGLMYEVNPELSFYSSYSEGFLPLSGTDYAGNPFDPELSDSYEIGAKFTTSGVTGTVAFFDAKKSNILTSDPVNVGFSATLGEATSRGIELDLQGQLTEQLSAQLSYAFLDTQTANDMINIDWGVNVPAGSRLVNIPKHNASLMLTQLLQIGSVESRLGLRVNHVAKRLGDSVDSSYMLPSHTLFGLSWAADLDQHWKAQLNIDNLFDKFYIHNSYSALWTVPGEPRSYKVSLTYAF